MIYPNSNYFDIGDKISCILKEVAQSEVERENPELAYVRCGTQDERDQLQREVDHRFNARANDFCAWLVDSYMEVLND